MLTVITASLAVSSTTFSPRVPLASASYPGTPGRILYVKTIAHVGEDPHDVLFAMNSDGTEQEPLFPNFGGTQSNGVWSPDGQKVAFDGSNGVGDAGGIYVGDADGTGTPVQVRSTGQMPTWSPDGTRLAFILLGHIWTMSADGSGANAITTGAHMLYPRWSPDGTQIAYLDTSSGGGQVFTVRLSDHTVRLRQDGGGLVRLGARQ